MTTLTRKQQKIYDFIVERYAAGLPVTYREIMAHFGYTSTNSVQCHIRPLTNKGFLESAGEYHARGLRPIPDPIARLVECAQATCDILRDNRMPALATPLTEALKPFPERMKYGR